MYDPNSPMLRTMTSGTFLVGLAVGALATYVFTNKAVQNALFRSAAKTVNVVKGGMAEAKERFHDAEAEVEMDAAVEDEEPAAG